MRPKGTTDAAAKNLQTIGEDSTTALTNANFTRLTNITAAANDAATTSGKPEQLIEMRGRVDKEQEHCLSLGNNKEEIVGASIDVLNKDDFSRLVEIEYPFGNQIKFKLVHNELSATKAGGSATTFNLNNTELNMFDALAVNFSILCEKVSEKY